MKIELTKEEWSMLKRDILRHINFNKQAYPNSWEMFIDSNIKSLDDKLGEVWKNEK
jgi:hypothetical protein